MPEIDVTSRPVAAQLSGYTVRAAPEPKRGWGNGSKQRVRVGNNTLTLMLKYWKWFLLLAIAAGIFIRFKLAAVPVEAHTVELREIVAEVMGTGTLDARIKTTISPRIQERLAEVLVDQNELVSQGQLLARLDDGELKRQVDVAAAALAAAKATVERVRSDEARAIAVEHQALQDHTRVSNLVATQISAQADLEKSVEQLRVAESEVQRARAAIVEARQHVVTAEKNHAYQLERLTFTEIRSPYDGLIIRRDRDPGGVVVPGSSLFHLIATNELWVSAWVDETAAIGLATGQTARVVFRSDPEKNYPGEVARLGRETDRETREFLVDVRVQELPPNWTLGQRAEVFITTGRQTNSPGVPPRFIEWRRGKPGVFVEEGGKARWREVSTGIRGREFVALERGAKAGDRVIRPTDRKQPFLREGQRVAAE